MPTDAERAFLDGFRHGSEWQITAHDPLLGLCAIYAARLPTADAVEVDAFVIERMHAVRRVREAQHEALDFYRRERDLTA
jgi:hypothetical protein